MQFKNFSIYLNKLEDTASRLEMTEILAELFKKCSNEEIDKICYLALGRLAPKYEGIEFNMGEKLVIRALALATKTSIEETTKTYKETGDLGKTILKLKSSSSDSEDSSSSSSSSNSRVIEIYQRLREVAEDAGEGSVERKINKLAKLLSELDSLSAKYVARIPVNKLRLGFSDMTILDALSWMKTGDKSLRPELERAFNVLADIGKIAKIFSLKGIKGLKGIKSEVGIPIRAALAERLKDPKKILEKMEGKCALEPKVDGMRCQIHIDRLKSLSSDSEDSSSLSGSKVQGDIFSGFGKKKGYFVRIFSRNLDNTTHMFPDIVEAVQKLNVKSVILDGEAIAFNPKTGKFLDFQETVQRKRKHGVGEKAKEIPLKVFVFDILYLNGKSLLECSFRERRRELERVISKSKGDKGNMGNKGTILLTRQKIITKASEFNKFFKEVVSEELEGLMAKKLDAVYQAGARNFNWVKYKAGMKSELADTIDCVVLGYYKGKGKRSKFGIGAFLVGVIDKKVSRVSQVSRENIVTVSKIGTGLTDEQWKRMFKCLKGLKVKKKPEEYVVDKNLNPDVWCRPELVVEIEADTITKSPIHTAGLALRFPRLKRFREDKGVDEATSLQEIKRLKN